MTNTTTKFETGKTFTARSACDHDCVFNFTVKRRTAKTVWVDVHGETVSRRVRVVDGVETFEPFGRFSMSPVVRASSVAD